MRVRKHLDGFYFSTEEGGYDLDAYARWIGGDLLVSIWGGERPHIGAVSLAQPRPSLKDPSVTSASASVICVVGHKEDDPAKKASELLAAALNTRVVVTAGIHWDKISEEGVRRLVQNSDALIKFMVQKLKESKTGLRNKKK